MSFLLMAQALSVKTGSCITKMVLLKLCDNANDEGKCWPSIQTVADHCELSRNSVKTHINKLVDMGIIKKETRRSGRLNKSNMYYINLNGRAGDAPPRAGAAPEPIKESINKEEREPSKVLLTYTLFNSAREGDGTFLDYYLKAHDKRWKEKHRSLKNETIVEYNNLLRALFDNDYIDGDSMVYEMSRYQNIGTKTDHHYPVFCLWLFSEKADDYYRGFNCDGSKMSVQEMINYLEEWA